MLKFEMITERCKLCIYQKKLVVYSIMNSVFIRDVIISGLIGGIFSYLVSAYHDNSPYLKTVAFLWGFQLLYLYIVFIMFNRHPAIVSDFTIHAIAGMMITLIILGILFMIGDNMNKLAAAAFSLISLFVAIRLYHIYELHLL